MAAAAVVAAVASPTPASDVEFALSVSDSLTADSIVHQALREEEGEDFNSLFDGTDIGAGIVIPVNKGGAGGIMSIDTAFAWSNDKINSGRFDYKTLGPGDTIRVPLIDTAHGKRFVHPFENYVTSRFGLRRYMWHYGTDIKLAKGDTLRSVFDGIVRVIQYERRGYGNVAVIRHHSGLETVYGHMQKVLVRPNQLVKAGDPIGLGGNTGRSTGAHLHFEIRYYGEPFNPEYIISFEPPYGLRHDTLILTRDNFEYLTEVRKTVYHVVRRGDNLGSIARRYGTSVAKLCSLNGITARTSLSIGRRLVIRSGKEAEKQVVGSPAAPPTPPMNTHAPADAHLDEAPHTGGPAMGGGDAE